MAVLRYHLIINSCAMKLCMVIDNYHTFLSMIVHYPLSSTIIHYYPLLYSIVHYEPLLSLYYPLLSIIANLLPIIINEINWYTLLSVIQCYPFIIRDYPLLSIITSYPVYSTIIHYDPLQLLSIIITPCRTEKAGFSKKNKNKNTIKSRITKKTTQQEELPQKQKKQEKKQKYKKKNNCIFLRFLSVFSCFSCWRVVFFCFFLFFPWFWFSSLFFVKPYILWVAGLMTLLSIINDYPWWLSMMITHFIIRDYPLLSNIINDYPLLLIGYTAFFNKRDWSPQLLRHAFCGYCRLCRPTSSKDVQHFLATTLNMKAPSNFNIHQKYVFICLFNVYIYIYIYIHIIHI